MRKLFLLMAVASILSCVKAFSQTVSFSGKNVPLLKIFSAVESQTSYSFFYDAALLREARPITIELKNVPLNEALNQIFKDQPLGWLIESKTIIIISKPLPPAIVEEASSPLIKVTGTIRDEDQIPIPGVSVMVKGTSQGTSANENGIFTIYVKKGTQLIFSSGGYVEKQIRVEAKTVAVQLQLHVKPMEKLIIGGNIMPIKRKADISAVDVIDSRTLENLSFQTIEQIFRGVVPGTNNMQPGYETAQYQYGSGVLSIRGSAGFTGYGFVKVFVDGIPCAGESYFLNTLDKNNIDHIEVVKGPSASTLYGSGSNGGVILVYTKKAAMNTTNINLTTSAGWYDSKWQDKKPFRQIHTFTIEQGYKNLSYFISGDINKNETYMPDGKQSRQFVSGGVHYTTGNLKINVSGQHFQNDFIVERNAFYDTSSNPYFKKAGYQLPDTAQGTVKSNTLGANITYRAHGWWVHNLVIGWNDNTFSTESYVRVTPPSLHSDDKYKGTSLRYYNTISFAARSNLKATLLTGAEYSNSLHTYFNVNRATTAYRITFDTLNKQKNTGVFAQLNPSYKNRIFLTLAGRYEFNKNFGSYFNPRIGLTTNFLIGQLILKPRVAWGSGITEVPWRFKKPRPVVQGVLFLPTDDLKPQQQAGWDYGLEGYVANDRLSFEISGYNNILKDAIYTSQQGLSPNAVISTVNAGKVENSGWEFSASYKFKNLSVSGNYSIMNAILKEPQSGNTSPKDIIYPGEQMQFTPKNAGGFIIGYAFPKLFGHSDRLYTSVNMTYTSGAYTVDLMKTLSDLTTGRYGANYSMGGDRYYKTQLPSVTRLYLNIEYTIVKELRFFMQLSNLTNNTSPEYKNDFPSIGRGWMFGLKYNFSTTAVDK
jgi:outer membrane receptor protein involved in Fe transport